MVHRIRPISTLLLVLTVPAGVTASPVHGDTNSTTAARSAGASGETTFFSDDRPLSLPSPDGRYRLVSELDGSGLVRLVAVSEQNGSIAREVVGTYEPPASVLWSPRSDAFFLNDQRGSGQTSYLEIVRLRDGRFHREATARRNLSRLFNRLFECELPESAIRTSGESWLDADRLIVEVQATLHSGGCPLDPFATNRLVLVVDAGTGEILDRRLERHS